MGGFQENLQSEVSGQILMVWAVKKSIFNCRKCSAFYEVRVQNVVFRIIGYADST